MWDVAYPTAVAVGYKVPPASRALERPPDLSQGLRTNGLGEDGGSRVEP